MSYLNGVIGEKAGSYLDKIRTYNAYTEDVRPFGNETNFITNPKKRGSVASALGAGLGLGMSIGGNDLIKNCNTKNVSLFSHKIPPKIVKYTGIAGMSLGALLTMIGGYELFVGKQVNI